MKKVKIGELKTHLSSHLKKVKKGETLLVLDRQEPIAKVIPLIPDHDLVKIIKKRQTPGALKKFKPRGIRAKIDVVHLLREMRGER